MAQTLLKMLNATQPANKLSESALLVIDAQREYLDGKLPLVNIDAALDQISGLLERARKQKTKIFFVRHSVGSGAPIFNPDSQYFQIIDRVKPNSGETIIDKSQANSFADTDLQELLDKTGLKKLIVTGFMTHACVSATVRSAAERGFNTTVIAGACATRDLPSADGATVQASEIHKATLAALQDLFATIVPEQNLISD